MMERESHVLQSIFTWKNVMQVYSVQSCWQAAAILLYVVGNEPGALLIYDFWTFGGKCIMGMHIWARG
jgi:hypothetical protein